MAEVAFITFLWMVGLVAVVWWTFEDWIDDIRWMRSQQRCRFCLARQQLEYAEAELGTATAQFDGTSE